MLYKMYAPNVKTIELTINGVKVLFSCDVTYTPSKDRGSVSELRKTLIKCKGQTLEVVS